MKKTKGYKLYKNSIFIQHNEPQSLASQKKKTGFLVLFCTLISITNSFGQNDVKQSDQSSEKIYSLSGPNSVEHQLKEDSKSHSQATDIWYALDSLDQRKKRFTDKTGFSIGVDYNSQIMGATETMGDDYAASGVFRVYGKWNLAGRGTAHEGGLVYKIEHRHKYTDLPLREWGLAGVGYAGFLQSVYNDQKFRVTNLYWRQTFGTDKVVVYAGFVDVTDWTDVYAMASPWSGFNNLAFATSSGTMGGLYPDGSLGVMISAWLTKNIYVVAGMVDLHGDATEFYKGFDTFFNDFETVKTFEVGYTPGLESVFFRNAHLTFWQSDETTTATSGWGAMGSVSWGIGNWFPFLRGGWSDGGGNSFYKASISTGIGYNIAGPNTLGVGLNWNKPNEAFFGGNLKDQYLSEIFYKWQVTHHTELTPSIQLLGNPALNPNSSFTTVFALRARVFL